MAMPHGSPGQKKRRKSHTQKKIQEIQAAT
jgi:hypothetical protein